jgi:hypothetical protein
MIAKPSNGNGNGHVETINLPITAVQIYPPILNEVKRKIDQDPDFVNLKRFDYSLTRVLERYPNGCPIRTIGVALAIPEEEVEEAYQRVILKLRKIIGVSE